MKRSVRRYKLALLLSLLLLSGFTIYANQALGFTISKSANYLRQALNQPAKPGGGHAAIVKPTQQSNDSTETALEPAQGALTIPQNVLPGGGGTSTGGANTLTGTIGQGIVGASSGGNFSLSGGFLGAISGSQCPTITISPATLPNGPLGQPYSRQLTQTGGVGTIAWTISAGTLPNGVTLNASTGLLSGTPVASGSFTFTVKATDANGCVGTQGYTLVIGTCPVISITPTTLPNGTVGTTYSQVLTASGGTGPYNFSVNPGSFLPANMELSPMGLLSGKPSFAGSFSFTVKVTDANSCIGTQSYAWTVNPGTYSVSGRVVDLTGIGIAGVTLTFSNSSGGAGSTQTDANGNWTQAGFTASTSASSCTNLYTVKAAKAGYSIAPASRTFCEATSSLDFTGATVVTTVSAASFLGNEIAPESIVAAFGINLATKVEIASATPLPTTLAGTTVKVKDSAGTERLAPLFFVAPSQVNYQVPPGTAVGLASVTVTSGDNKISQGTINVAKVAPGLFSANASGQGVAAAVLLRIRNGVQTFESVSRFDQAAGGQVPIQIDMGPAGDVIYLLAYGSGLRGRTAAGNISVNLGGIVKSLNPNDFEDVFATPGFIGLDQASILLPRTLIGKGLINLTMTVDGKTSNTVQINIK